VGSLPYALPAAAAAVKEGVVEQCFGARPAPAAAAMTAPGAVVISADGKPAPAAAAGAAGAAAADPEGGPAQRGCSCCRWAIFLIAAPSWRCTFHRAPLACSASSSSSLLSSTIRVSTSKLPTLALASVSGSPAGGVPLALAPALPAPLQSTGTCTNAGTVFPVHLSLKGSVTGASFPKGLRDCLPAAGSRL
jgi:hypothetical protein